MLIEKLLLAIKYTNLYNYNNKTIYMLKIIQI